jgi:integrase
LTLHQIRHSALTRAAENGALLAYSGHTSVASLAIYTRVSPDALGRWQAQRDTRRPSDSAQLKDRPGSYMARFCRIPATPQ